MYGAIYNGGLQIWASGRLADKEAINIVEAQDEQKPLLRILEIPFRLWRFSLVEDYIFITAVLHLKKILGALILNEVMSMHRTCYIAFRSEILGGVHSVLQQVPQCQKRALESSGRRP